jgi:hypothetical protein
VKVAGDMTLVNDIGQAVWLFWQFGAKISGFREEHPMDIKTGSKDPVFNNL